MNSNSRNLFLYHYILNQIQCTEYTCNSNYLISFIHMQEDHSLLQRAIDRDSTSMVEFLVNHKADPNSRDLVNEINYFNYQ